MSQKAFMPDQVILAVKHIDCHFVMELIRSQFLIVGTCITPKSKNPLLLYHNAKKNSNIIPHTYLCRFRIRNRHQ